MPRWLPWLAVATVIVTACGRERSEPGAEPRLGATAQANQGASTSSYPYAVGVCLSASGPGACGRTCSGTLVAPNLVLTARHCVDKDTNPAGELHCGTDNFTTRQTTPAQTFVTTANLLNQS